MPQGPQGQKGPEDVLGNAVHIPKIAFGEIRRATIRQKAKRSSLLANYKARIGNLTEAQRVENARASAMKRWE